MSQVIDQPIEKRLSLQIYDLPTAKESILKRVPLDEISVPPGLMDSIERTFNERLSPSQAVSKILTDVRQNGDEALRTWSRLLDGCDRPIQNIPQERLAQALAEIDPKLRAALENSARRIEAFHRKQPHLSWISPEGGVMGQIVRPLKRVGIYVPGGTAPLPSSILMTAIPARVAGVDKIVMVTPPRRSDGEIQPILLATAALAGVDEVYALGGAQAIAALAYGTQTIQPVDKIVGPGNLFVTLAKQQVFGRVGIDGLAGPTETVVIADDSACPQWVASDLLAQAEHDQLAAAILITPSMELAESVQKIMSEKFSDPATSGLSRTEIIIDSFRNRGGIILVDDIAQAIETSNAYGPEHLNLVVKDAWSWVDKITCAGGIFVGEHSYEVLGDYIAGPSHVMPTGGTARFASPLNVWDFIHIISLIALDESTGKELGIDASRIAMAEGLTAHALSANVRQGKKI